MLKLLVACNLITFETEKWGAFRLFS